MLFFTLLPAPTLSGLLLVTEARSIRVEESNWFQLETFQSKSDKLEKQTNQS